MNIYAFFRCFLTVLFLCGCSPEGQESLNNRAPESSSQTELTESETIEVMMPVDDTMQFKVKRFEVRAGQKVRLSLRHSGRMPKQAMGHNWVLLKKGTDKSEFGSEAVRHASTQYVPPDSTAVIAHTRMIGGGEEDEITFVAPLEPGEYDYICSFPGHTQSGMTGVMVVR